MKKISIKSFFDYIATRGRFFNFCLGLACMTVVCVLDHVINDSYSFYFFYLFPVAFTSWFSGSVAGIVIGFISTAFWVSENDSYYFHTSSLIWNAATTFVVFVSVSLLVAKVYRMWLNASQQSRIDYLTGLCNARAFMEKLDYEISRAGRDGEPFSLGYIDLDNFKQVNDLYGHKKGDELLQCVSACFTSGLRKTDLVARMGGDEFCVYCPATGYEAVQVVIRKVRESLLDKMKQERWPTTFSMGVVTCLVPPRNADEIVLYADKIMYRAKNAGKNRINFVVFTGEEEL